MASLAYAFLCLSENPQETQIVPSLSLLDRRMPPRAPRPHPRLEQAHLTLGHYRIRRQAHDSGLINEYRLVAVRCQKMRSILNIDVVDTKHQEEKSPSPIS